MRPHYTHGIHHLKVKDRRWNFILNTSNMNEISTDSSLERWQDIVYRFTSVAVGLVSVFGNTMTIVAIQRREKLQTIPNKFILNLAVADLLIVCQIILKVMVTSGVREEPICTLSSIVWDVSTLMSISSLVLVAGDRFLYIYRPLRYSLIVTSGRANIIITSTWFIVVMFCFVLVISNLMKGANMCDPFYPMPFWFRASKFAICALMVVLLFSFYALLVRIVLKQRRIIAIQLGSTAAKKPADYKFLKMILPVALISEFCWAPYVTLQALAILGWPQYMRAASLYIGIAFYLNAAVNFFVYAARNRDFLNTYKSLLSMKTDEDKTFPSLTRGC